jgi:hypothetical protein
MALTTKMIFADFSNVSRALLKRPEFTACHVRPAMSARAGPN